MQIEVHHEKKISITTDVERCRKESQRGPSKARVIFRRVLPNGSERTAMCDRDVIKLSIRRNDDAMRTIDVDRHVARIDCCSIRAPAGPKRTSEILSAPSDTT